MGQRMNDRQRRAVTVTIQTADPCPQDIDDCLDLLKENEILTQAKIETFWVEFVQVCKQAMHARPPSPPRSAISTPSPADSVPDALHADEALHVAARDSRDKPTLAVNLYHNATFFLANAKFTNVEFSYILEKRAKSLGLQYTNGSVQIQWNDPNPPQHGDHTVRETVFLLVSEEDASSVNMNVDILFGKHFREDCHTQSQAVCASTNIQSDLASSSPSEIQPDDSCANPMAESASTPTQALGCVPMPLNRYAVVFIGPDEELRAAKFTVARDRETARQQEVVSRGMHVPGRGSQKLCNVGPGPCHKEMGPC